MKNLDQNSRRALFSSIFASGLDDLNVMFLSFTLSSIITELNISGTMGGWIATITNLGMLFGGLFFGTLADRYNKFTVLKWTILIFSVATGLIFFVDNIYALYLLRFISGIGVGGEYGVAIAIMAGIVPASKMGRISSLNGVVGQIGSIAAALLAGFIAPMFGWRGLFLFGFLPILLVAYMHFFIDDQAVKDGDMVSSETRKLKSDRKGSIKALFETPQLARQTISLMIMTTVQIAGYFGMMNWLPSIMQQNLGISVSNSSTWMIATIVGMSIGMLVFGQILDKFGPRLSFGVFLICSAISVFLFSYADTAIAVIVGGAIVGFFVNGMFAGYGAITTHLYDYDIRSTANNVILNVGRAVGGFSSVIIGFILDHSNVMTVMVFLAVLYLISFSVMLTMPNLKRETYQTINQDGKLSTKKSIKTA